MLTKHMASILICLAILACTYHSESWAWVPPEITVEEALKNGTVAFIGRVVRNEEIRADRAQVIVEAKVKVQRCFYGLDCDENEYLFIRYLRQGFVDTVFRGPIPLRLGVSYEYLIILNNPISSSLITFNSDESIRGRKGIDVAYMIGSSIIDNMPTPDIMRLFYVYHRGIVYEEKITDVEQWANERAGQLNGEEAHASDHRPPIRTGMARSEIAAFYPFISERSQPLPEPWKSHPAYEITADNGVRFALVFDEDDMLSRIISTDRSYRLSSGIGIGSSFAEIERSCQYFEVASGPNGRFVIFDSATDLCFPVNSKNGVNIDDDERVEWIERKWIIPDEVRRAP